MKVDLSAEEMEKVIQALKVQVSQRRAAGDPSTQTEALIARLEQNQREHRGQKS